MQLRLVLILLPAFLFSHAGIAASPGPDFSGTWQQSNDRCVPKRTGDVTLKIDQQDRDLVVETTILRPSGPPRHAVQRYTIDGKISVSTGADGDEFHTAVIRDRAGLVFSIEEHEDGRVLLSTETWTLIENGSALLRERTNLNTQDGTRKKLIYLRK